MSKCGMGAAVLAVRGPATVDSGQRRVVGCATCGGAVSCGPTPAQSAPVPLAPRDASPLAQARLPAAPMPRRASPPRAYVGHTLMCCACRGRRHCGYRPARMGGDYSLPSKLARVSGGCDRRMAVSCANVIAGVLAAACT